MFTKKLDEIILTITPDLHTKNLIFLNRQKEKGKNFSIFLKPDVSAVVCEQDYAENISFYLSQGASLEFFTLMTKPISKKIKIFLFGKNSCARLNGIYLLQADSSVSLETRQEHRAEKTKSFSSLSGVISGNASLTHRGVIFSDKLSEKVQASQKNRTILLSKNAQIDSSPELELLNNKTKCSHSSAIGRIESEQLFYLRSRGLCEKLAKHLLLETFISLPFAALSDKNLRKQFSNIISHKLQEMV